MILFKRHKEKEVFKKDNQDAKFKYDSFSVISNSDSQERMWKIYSDAFFLVNKLTPCQQSIKTEEEFVELMESNKVTKYVVSNKEKIMALALVSSTVEVCNWLSTSYYDSLFGEYIKRGHFFYFLGLAVDQECRRIGLAKSLLEFVLASMPKDSVVGFDHSFKVNRFLPQFINLVNRGKHKIKNRELDKQVYHIINLK